MTPQFKHAASWEIHFEKSMSFRVFVGATQQSNIFVLLPFYLKEMVQHQYFQERKCFTPTSRHKLRTFVENSGDDKWLLVVVEWPAGPDR